MLTKFQIFKHKKKKKRVKVHEGTESKSVDVKTTHDDEVTEAHHLTYNIHNSILSFSRSYGYNDNFSYHVFSLLNPLCFQMVKSPCILLSSIQHHYYLLIEIINNTSSNNDAHDDDNYNSNDDEDNNDDNSITKVHTFPIKKLFMDYLGYTTSIHNPNLHVRKTLVNSEYILKS